MMMSSIPLNATMMVVIVASKGMMVGMTSVLLANAWVWIVTRLSKSLGEMEEGVMENITMLDASLMEVIAARTLIAKNAKMILLLSKLDQLEHMIFDVSIKLVKNKEIVSNESFLYFLNKNTHDAYPEKDLRSFMTL